MRKPFSFFLLISIALSSFLAGCSDDGAQCGAGTTEVDGECIPDSDMICATGTHFDMTTGRCELDEAMGLTCGTGTIMNDAGACVSTTTTIECADGTVLMEGTCVPDGSVLCEGNTIFDMESGTCVIDPDAICEGDTVFVMETESCVPRDETLLDMADVLESNEPNDPDVDEAAMLTELVIPATGSLSFGGCIEPQPGTEDLTELDADVFLFNADGPTLLEFTTDGIGGLSAGIRVEPGTDQPELSDEANDGANGWLRYVMNLAGDGATGRVFFPAAGAYYVRVSDSRTFLIGLPAGGEGHCYFNQVSRVELPTPTPLTVGTEVTGSFGDPQFYTVAAADELLFVALTELDPEGTPADIENQIGALVVNIGDTFDSQSIIGSWDGLATALAPIANVGATDDVLLVVDQAFSLLPDPVDFSLLAKDSGVVEIPADGSVMLTVPEDFDPNDPTTWNILSFDGLAGDVAHITFDGGTTGDFDTFVAQPDFLSTSPCTGCSDFDVWVSLGESGQHFVYLINNAAMPGDMYEVDFTLDVVTPSAETRDMATSVDLDTQDLGFLVADLTGAEWIAMSVANLTGITDVLFETFPAGEFGILGGSLVSDDIGVVTATETAERILRGVDVGRVLVALSNDSDTGGTFDFTISNVPFTELAASSTGMMGLTAPADGEPARFIVNGAIFADLSVTASTMTSTVDLGVDIYDQSGSSIVNVDDNGAGGDEVYTATVAPPGWFAMGVSDLSGTGGTFDLALSSTPGAYGVVVQDTELTSICPSQGGTGEAFFMGDDAVSTSIDLTMPTPFGFDFFGSTVTEMTLSTNGWITFTPDYMGGSFLPAETGLVISPYAADLISDEICTLRSGDTYTIEYRGATFDFFGAGDPVEMQVRLTSTTGVIELIYGADHIAAGTGFIGLRDGEDPFNELDFGSEIEPGTVLVWTPN